MHQVASAAHALLTAATQANLSPAALLRITAAALAEKYCSCSGQTCRACREAEYLDRIADQVDHRSEAVFHVVEACGNAGANLGDLLPGIVEGMLAHEPTACACDDDTMCPTCSAARELDNVSRELRLAS